MKIKKPILNIEGSLLLLPDSFIDIGRSNNSSNNPFNLLQFHIDKGELEDFYQYRFYRELSENAMESSAHYLMKYWVQ